MVAPNSVIEKQAKRHHSLSPTLQHSREDVLSTNTIWSIQEVEESFFKHYSFDGISPFHARLEKDLFTHTGTLGEKYPHLVILVAEMVSYFYPLRDIQYEHLQIIGLIYFYLYVIDDTIGEANKDSEQYGAEKEDLKNLYISLMTGKKPTIASAWIEDLYTNLQRVHNWYRQHTDQEIQSYFVSELLTFLHGVMSEDEPSETFEEFKGKREYASGSRILPLLGLFAYDRLDLISSYRSEPYQNFYASVSRFTVFFNDLISYCREVESFFSTEGKEGTLYNSLFQYIVFQEKSGTPINLDTSINFHIQELLSDCSNSHELYKELEQQAENIPFLLQFLKSLVSGFIRWQRHTRTKRYHHKNHFIQELREE